MSRRSLLALLMIGIGSVQAWDSKVLLAEPFVQMLVATAILLQTAVVFLAARKAIQIGAVVAAIGLTIVARMTSEVRLPELTLAAVFPAMIVWINLYMDAVLPPASVNSSQPK